MFIYLFWDEAHVGSRGQLGKGHLSFQHVNHRAQIQTLRLGSKRLCPRSQLPCLNLVLEALFLLEGSVYLVPVLIQDVEDT